LIAYLPFNGNADDAGGNGNSGDVLGPILVPDRFGRQNCAYSFDGIDDFIMLSNNESINWGTNDFSISTVL